MAVEKLIKKTKPKIIFGLVLSDLEANLYNVVKPIKLAQEILKESLNINSNRLIKIVEAVDNLGNVISILVIFDYIIKIEEKNRFFNLEVKDFNFNILNFNRKDGKLDIENLILDFQYSPI